MKVKCVRLLNHSGEKVSFSPWLRLGEIYHVLSIFVDGDGKRSLGIVTSELPGEWPDFGSHQMECFEIVSTIVPSNWRVWIYENSAIGVSPAAWQAPGFSEAFMEHEPAAHHIFDQERKVILAEDP